jgi:hypothetical protein
MPNQLSLSQFWALFGFVNFENWEQNGIKANKYPQNIKLVLETGRKHFAADNPTKQSMSSLR